ncbi:hypothetical protein C4577_06870 [Candidatus Parcubacteria bacterium]|nr:MAG: hypothetical protein C4577_06870 [Candidatus Parcubacteria bacterium]
MSDSGSILSRVGAELLETTKKITQEVVKTPLELVKTVGEQLSDQELVQRQKQDKAQTEQKLAQARNKLHGEINSAPPQKPSEEFHTDKREQRTGISEFEAPKTSQPQSSPPPHIRRGTKETGKMKG